HESRWREEEFERSHRVATTAGGDIFLTGAQHRSSTTADRGKSVPGARRSCGFRETRGAWVGEAPHTYFYVNWRLKVPNNFAGRSNLLRFHRQAQRARLNDWIPLARINPRILLTRGCDLLQTQRC